MNNTELVAQARLNLRTSLAQTYITLLADALEAAQPAVKPWRKPGDDIPVRSLTQPAGEPVAIFRGSEFRNTFKILKEIPTGANLYTHPEPQVPMTENQIDSDLAKVISDYPNAEGSSVEKLNWYKSLYRRAEAHHKIGVKP